MGGYLGWHLKVFWGDFRRYLRGYFGGTVDGNVRVESRAVLGAESQLKGDLIYRTLVIEEGAQFQGHCVLAGSEPIVEPKNQQDLPQVEDDSDHHGE